MPKRLSVQKNGIEYIAIIISALIVAMLCSRSSFLYALNLWDDVNSYFTMGKSMMHGVVPYRDLFDQKGILLYFMYGVGYLIDNTGFFGVFIIEVVFAISFLIAMYKFVLTVTGLYAAKSKPSNETNTDICKIIALVISIITTALIYTSRAFYWGGSAEEFMLPVLMWGLYYLCSYFLNEFPNPMSRGKIFIGGVLAGMILHIKFNSLGFYFGFAMMVAVSIFLDNGSHDFGSRLIRIIKAALLFLSGMLVVTLPFLIYFLVNHAIYDWFHVYIYLNVFAYSEKLPFGERIYNMIKTIYFQFEANPEFSIFIIVGVIIGFMFLIYKRKSINYVLTYLSCLITSGLLLFVIFIGGVDLPYYPLPVSIFACMGAAVISCLVTGVFAEKSCKPLLKLALMCVAIVAAALICYFNSSNVSDMKLKRDDLWVYDFYDEIRELGYDDDVKLLNVYCFDAGLYTVCNSVPGCYFFQTQTINLGEDYIYNYQKDYIYSGEADFVLSRDSRLDYAYDVYELIDEKTQAYGGFEHTYYLYHRK